MKAALLEHPGSIETRGLRLAEVADPTAGPGQVLIRVSACGVCRSNLNMIEGDWLPETPASLPIIPGHEVVGAVISVGDGLTSIGVGARVGVQPIWRTCGICQFCLNGKEQLCRARQITGETRDGGYAELMVADAAFVYPIPDSLSDVEAAPLLCPGITAYGAVEKARLGPGQKVAIFGIGGVGHMAVQLAVLAGAEAYAVTRSRPHQQLAEELGATGVFAPFGSSGHNMPAESMDAAIVFAPSPQAVNEAVYVSRPGARIVLGVAQPIETVNVGDEKIFLGTVLGNRWQVRQVLDLAATRKITTVHETFPLCRANDALAALKGGKVRGRAVLVP